MGTGQLVCLVLGVLLLAVGAGMLGGRYALERYGDVSGERPPDTAESVGTPGAKQPSAAEPPFASAPVEFEWAGEADPAPGGEPIPVVESDAAARKEGGDAPETASPREILPVEGPYVAPREGVPAVEETGGESQSRYVIQAMSTSSRPDARAARGAVMKAGFPAGVFEAELPGRGKWYRVYIGPYDSAEEARPALEAVRRIPGFEGSFLKTME